MYTVRESDPVHPLGVAEERPARAPADSVDSVPTDAARLFTNRLETVRPGFQMSPDTRTTIEAICRRLDGLPLAIELAAAQAVNLPLSAMLDGLSESHQLLSNGPAREEAARHESLQATIDWSYGLLDPVERSLLLRLSVFRGGFTPDDRRFATCGGRLPID